MNVGAIIGNTGDYNYQSRMPKGNSAKSFQTAVGGVTEMPGPKLTLHISKEGDSDIAVGSWANANSGRNVTVYQPQDFDSANPVYKLKIWDDNDNLLEERTVELNQIDPNHADSYEMYALSVYGEKSGQCPDAVARFTMMHAGREAEQRNQFGSYMLDKKYTLIWESPLVFLHLSVS